jgi:hypothetical protein
VASALAHLLARTSAAEAGRWLGVADTTITRRGDDLRTWPADDLLRLSGHDADLAQALARCGSGVEAEQPEPVRAIPALLAEIESGGELTREIAAVLRDNRVSSTEARRLRKLIEARHAEEHTLLVDLAAIEGGE